MSSRTSLPGLARLAGPLRRALGLLTRRATAPAGPPRGRPAGPTSSGRSAGYPGDITGPLRPTYEPHPDDLADPGEVVWAWVPYEEDHARGKDRPVLVVGSDGPWLLVLPLSSEDHERDRAQEESVGRYWVAVGTGPWDRRRRPSWAHVNRVVRVHPRDVRRIGATLERPVFERVAEAMGRHRR